MSNRRDYPIYSMYEVFHVKRKTAFDLKEEQRKMSEKSKSLTIEEISGKTQNPNESFLL